MLFIFSRLNPFQNFHIWHLQPRPSGKSFSAGISLHREKSRNSFRAVFGHLILHFNVFYFRTCWSAVDLLTASQIPQNSFWNQSWNLASRVCTLNNKISVKNEALFNKSTFRSLHLSDKRQKSNQNTARKETSKQKTRNLRRRSISRRFLSSGSENLLSLVVVHASNQVVLLGTYVLTNRA